jgi:Protein of unknown function (DUF1214)
MMDIIKKTSMSALLLALLSQTGFSQETMTVEPESEWRSYVEPLLPIGDRLVHSMLADSSDPLLRKELYRAVFMALAGGYLPLFHTDPKYPELVPYTGQFLNLLGPNPDAVYYMSAIEGSGVYRLFGYRGTVKEVVVQVGAGEFVTRGGGATIGTTLANYDLDDLQLAEDGSFSVILSATRPEGYEGDWWHLPENATNLPIRQVSYDWINEEDARITIERLDVYPAKPRMTADEIDATLKQLSKWAESYIVMSNKIMQSYEDQGLINKLAFIPFGEHGGMPTQKYPEGIFELAEDEALILETEIPDECHYWSFQLTDTRWTSYDWAHRQTSINGFTGILDTDGKFRAVISSKDPGVPNWLDTLDYKRGVIQGRWKRCTSWPMPEITKVKFSDIRKYLPKDTPEITLAQREKQLRLRNIGVQLRKKW